MTEDPNDAMFSQYDSRGGCVWLAILAFLLVLFGVTTNLPAPWPTIYWIFTAVIWLSVFWFFSRINRARQRTSEKDAKELFAYLNERFPLPAFDAGISDAEWQKRRDDGHRTRYQASIDYYERRRGRPLTAEEKNYVEELLQYSQEDFPANPVPKSAPDVVVISEELERYFGSEARFFTRQEKQTLSQLQYKDRIQRYLDIKALRKKLTPTDLEGPAAPSSNEPNEVALENEIASDFPDLAKEIDSLEKLLLYAEIKEAKIRYEYMDSPTKSQERLRILRNMILRYRNSRSW